MSEPTGLDSDSKKLIKNIFLQSLQSKKAVTVFVFGSRSKNTHKKYSDLDLWVESNPVLTAQEIAELHDKFEESDLAIQVDIVTPESCLPAYLEQIQSEKKVWFTR